MSAVAMNNKLDLERISSDSSPRQVTYRRLGLNNGNCSSSSTQDHSSCLGWGGLCDMTYLVHLNSRAVRQ